MQDCSAWVAAVGCVALQGSDRFDMKAWTVDFESIVGPWDVSRKRLA